MLAGVEAGELCRAAGDIELAQPVAYKPQLPGEVSG